MTKGKVDLSYLWMLLFFEIIGVSALLYSLFISKNPHDIAISITYLILMPLPWLCAYARDIGYFLRRRK